MVSSSTLLKKMGPIPVVVQSFIKNRNFVTVFVALSGQQTLVELHAK